MVNRAYLSRSPLCMSSFLPASLDPTEVDLKFLAEGNANVIYRIAPVRSRQTSVSHSDTFGKLIKLDAYKILEPDWRYSYDPKRQRSFNRDMAKQKFELIKPYEDAGLKCAAADFVTKCTRADLTGASKDMLLRLKKKVPFYQDDRTTYDFYLNTISDWIPQRHLVHQDLISISNDIIENCNTELRMREKNGKRESKRHGTYLHTTDSAIIMRDMNSYDAQKSLTLEFKPKWLWQSPTAPRDATRCRTCALRAQRKSKGEKESKTHGVLCPMVIATGEENYVRDVVTQLVDNPSNYVGTALPRWLADRHATNGTNGPTHENGPKSRSDLIKKLCDHFSASRSADGKHGDGYHVLQGLQNMQRDHDRHGILDRDPSPDFLLAMTLRDCSLYVQVHWESQRVESRLGDLDPKVSKGGKLEQWRETEQGLLDGRWYYAAEGDETCLLSRPNWSLSMIRFRKWVINEALNPEPRLKNPDAKGSDSATLDGTVEALVKPKRVVSIEFDKTIGSLDSDDTLVGSTPIETTRVNNLSGPTAAMMEPPVGSSDDVIITELSREEFCNPTTNAIASTMSLAIDGPRPRQTCRLPMCALSSWKTAASSTSPLIRWTPMYGGTVGSTGVRRGTAFGHDV